MLATAAAPQLQGRRGPTRFPARSASFLGRLNLEIENDWYKARWGQDNQKKWKGVRHLIGMSHPIRLSKVAMFIARFGPDTVQNVKKLIIGEVYSTPFDS